MEIDIIEGVGERFFAHARFQHLAAIRVAQDTRFFGAGAQGAGDFGGLPMGVHVDHGLFSPVRRAA